MWRPCRAVGGDAGHHGDECRTKWALSTLMVLKHQEALFTPWITANLPREGRLTLRIQKACISSYDRDQQHIFFWIHLGLYTVTQAVNTLHVAHFVYAWKPQHDHLPADVIIDQLSHKVSSTSPTQLGLRVMSRCNIKNMNTKCIIDDILLVVLDMP